MRRIATSTFFVLIVYCTALAFCIGTNRTNLLNSQAYFSQVCHLPVMPPIFGGTYQNF